MALREGEQKGKGSPLTDPEFLRQSQERRLAMEKRAAEIKVAEAPLLRDLADLGFEVDSVWFLRSKYKDYKKAIPVLLDHLRRPYPDIIRAGIAQALAIRATRKLGWDVLIEEFRKTDVARDHVKSSIAAALSQASDDSVIRDLIELAKDKTQGTTRVALLLGIKRSKSLEAKRAIEELAQDPELAKEIKSWGMSRK